ncbi:hypothetical protein [Dyella jiangningensis]|uniref:Uncharacterized protein n=1 Tax=Dyella jiangningensis TaxID=1379159 RepID=A0A328P1E9_9GAMM|nr:hypothetical protein [Dyella jiangningensis]RAO75181.1 hypothetical protein CA260_13850 [Dyella jiangningensis]
MLTFLLVVLALIALAVFPVMYTARALGAEKTSIGSVLLVLVLQLCLSRLVDMVISSGLVAALAGFFGGALIIQMVMVTTYKRALLISLVSSVITIIGVLLLIKLMGNHGAPVEEVSMLLTAQSGRIA